MTHDMWPLTMKKNEKKHFPIEFIVNKTWDPPVGPIVVNVLNTVRYYMQKFKLLSANYAIY